MTVLWILLGVLAAIILLLCLPLTLRLSWLPKPEQPAPCLLTDEVNKEIEALDLPQTDRQLLRQMVEQTKAPPVTENQLKVDVKVLLTIHLFPFAQKKKVTPKKQQKQPQKKQEKASDSNEQKPKTSEILAMLPQLWQCAKKPLQMVLGDVCLHHLKLYGIVSREDTAQSALEAQKFSTLLYTLLGMVQNIGRVKRTDIRIEPDFWGTGQERWQLRSPNRGSGSCCPLCSLLFKAAALPKGNGQAAAEGFHLLHNRRWKISSPNTGSKPIKSTQSKGRII